MKQHSNNQKPRPRGRMPGGPQQRKGGGGGGQSRNQTYDSNGPSVRIRGSAHQVMEKYLALARDAAGQGDRVLAENYLQHAEHYFRIIQNTQPRPQRVLSPAAADGADGPQPDQSEGADEGAEEEESDEAVVEVIRPAARQAEPEPEDADPIAV